MRSRKHENRPGLGCEGLLSSRTETISLESVEHRVTGKLVAKAKPQLKLAVTVSPNFIQIRERK